MKIFVKLLILVLIAALAGPFFIKGPDGQPLLTGQDVKRQWRELTRDMARWTGDGNADKVPVHRWQDAEGVWHYSDKHGAAPGSDVIYVNPNVNTLPAVKVPPVNEPATRAAQPPPPVPSVPLPLTISPGKVRQLIDDAKNVQDQLDERAEEIEKKINAN